MSFFIYLKKNSYYTLVLRSFSLESLVTIFITMNYHGIIMLFGLSNDFSEFDDNSDADPDFNLVIIA